MWEPQDVTLAPTGELWINDFNHYNVRAIDAEGIIRSVIGIARLGDGPPPGEQVSCVSVGYNHTPTLVFHDGYAYLAAWHNRRIMRVDMATRMVENYAGTGTAERYYGDGGPALEAAVDLPSGIAVDPEGRITWMSQADQVIRRVDLDGNVERIVGTCIAGELVDACEPGEEPVACPDSNRTVCGDPEILCAEFCSPGFAGDGGPALEARMAQGAGQSTKPGGRLIFDAAGNLYFADRDNNRIRMVRAEDQVITTIAGNGDGGYSGDGGPATEAALNRPIDLALGDDGSLFFTDTANSCVRKIAPDQTISTVAGVCRPGGDTAGAILDGGPSFGGDGGPATEGLLNWPYGIEVVGDKLYVADSYNQRVRVVNL
jgi:hypothetical protein